MAYLSGPALYEALKNFVRENAGKWKGKKLLRKWIAYCLKVSGKLPSKSFFNNEFIKVLPKGHKLAVLDYLTLSRNALIKGNRATYSWEEVEDEVCRQLENPPEETTTSVAPEKVTSSSSSSEIDEIKAQMSEMMKMIAKLTKEDA